MRDIIIIGGGPAGLSAAITARARNHSVAVISNDRANSGLYKAKVIGNYPGLPGVSGSELLDGFIEHALSVGAELISGRVSVVMQSGGDFNVGYGEEILSSKRLLVATGVAQTSLFPGEEELLGRGVSYCATCDGMLYRGRRVCVVCLAKDAGDEAEHLKSIGCDVVYVTAKNIRINGSVKVESVTADGVDVVCEAVFILREAVTPHLLIPGLETENSHIRADLSGKTNIPGVFAAGDCAGTPYQIAKAVGQGQIAALSASESINKGVL